MSKFWASILSALSKPAVQSQLIASAVALVGAFGFHLPATDLAMIVSGAVGLVTLLTHAAQTSTPPVAPPVKPPVGFGKPSD